MEKKTIDELHSEHKEWINKLAFYADEVALMKKHVSDIAARNTQKETLAQVEHFQNQLIIQKDHIDTLKHEVNDHESYLENRVDENPVAAGKRMVHDHPLLRDRMESFEKIFNELRRELLVFLSRTM